MVKVSKDFKIYCQNYILAVRKYVVYKRDNRSFSNSFVIKAY